MKETTLAAALALSGIVVLSDGLAAQGGVFGPQQIIAAGGASCAYAMDLDGDGDADALSAGGSQVAWHENLGGSFGPPQVITTVANGVQSVYATDLDGDGDADALSAGGSQVAWYENLGGSFGPPQVITTAANGAQSVYATDLDGDGDADVLSALMGDGKIAWYENLGGSFGRQQVIGAAGQFDGPASVYATDLDGDGDSDVLAAIFVGSKIVWHENLGGRFGPQRVIAAALYARNVYAADLDGDGDADVLSVSSTTVGSYFPVLTRPVVAWHENLGGRFGPQQVITTAGLGVGNVYAADLDWDGDADVLTGIGSMIARHENLGGSFGPQQVITTGTVGFTSSCVYAADLDGDGDADVLSADGAQLAWYENQVINLPGPHSGLVATLLSPAISPAPLRGHVMAKLSAGAALLFGGEFPGGFSANTYELVGTTWAQKYPLFTPTQRQAHALVTDSTRQECLLFGGENPIGAKLGDTWTYAGGEWAYRAPAQSPSARAGHAMVYEPGSSSALLFGGESSSGAPLADMWSWDGTDWTQLSPITVPPARLGHGMAYDELRGRVVLFGGSDGTARLQDVWEWDGNDWVEITPAQHGGRYWGPSARVSFAMAYDLRAERVLVHGGETDQGCASDFWSWDGVEWTQHLPAGAAPTARSGHAMFFDPAVNELRLFGGACGTTFSNELWQMDLPVESRFGSFGAGCGYSGLSVRPGMQPILGQSIAGDLEPLPYDFYQPFRYMPFVMFGLNRDRWVGGALPMDLGFLGMPGCSLLMSWDATYGLRNFGGAAFWTLSIPNNPGMLGRRFYLQGLVTYPGANYQGIVLSNGLEFRIGDR